ncbi:MAG TPA: hypothetical protein VNF26_11145 [Candidatus Baltobacterales bacterium]|nr:hypothetical protein [Candidatus Baltobacterales bacterium]
MTDVNRAAQAPVTPQTRFSADGLWWWDGTEWKPAVSPDRLWRWNGLAWEAAAPGPAHKGSGVGVAIGLTVAMFVGVLVLVAITTAVIVLTLGDQIANVFSNVAAALGSTPSP